MPLSVSSVSDPEAIWGDVRPMMETAFKKGGGGAHSVDDVLESAKKGIIEFLLVHEGPEIIACIGYSILEGTNAKYMTVPIMGGRDMDRWLDRIIDTLIEIRDLNQAKYLETHARPGLAKALKERGWKEMRVWLEAP